MTSEVALLNKTCVAMAADSATTVTYWDKGQPMTRYFKGANKIFNLSNAHPVGLMTYASASLQGVPWEVIAKAYRAHIGGKSHDELPGYAESFFDFIVSNVHMFPLAVQEEQFNALADRVAVKIVGPILSAKTVSEETDQSRRAEAFSELFSPRSEEVRSSELLPGASSGDVDSVIAKYEGQVQSMLAADTWYDLVPREALSELAEVTIRGIYTNDFTGLQRTGLAFAGYGDKEYFPRMTVYRCSGMVLGKLLCSQEEEFVISQQNGSDLVTLAMSEMIDTFTWGIGDSVFEQINRSFSTNVAGLLDDLRGAGHLKNEVDFKPFIEKTRKDHLDGLFRQLHDSHRAPLKRVISNLPVSEMVELAETLVFMESMKERVTTPTESVSGPIDVAVISKGDGFVWIKRKHYFDPALNPRFFNRDTLR